MFVGRGRRVSRTRMSIKHAGVHPDRYFSLFAFFVLSCAFEAQY